MHKASLGLSKGVVSAQKAPQGSEAETRELLGGTEENIVSPMLGPGGQKRFFFTYLAPLDCL